MRLEDAVIARLRIRDHAFEIYVDLDKAINFKEGKLKNIEEVLVVEEIYKDAKKGERVSEHVLKEVFGTEDIYEIASQIIKRGEIQVTAEYRRKLIGQKRKQIIEIIRRLAIDPRTNLPFTPHRIEEMLNQVKVNIDPFKPVEIQANEIIKQIKKKFPIRVEVSQIKVFIPYEEVKAVNLIKKKYKVLKEDWGDEGWFAVVEIPSGIKSEFFSDLGNYTRGKGSAEELKH